MAAAAEVEDAVTGMRALVLTLALATSMVAPAAHAALRVLIVSGLGGEADYEKRFTQQAEAIAKADRARDMLAWLSRWIRDLVLIQVGGDRDQLLYLDDLVTLEAYAQQANTDWLLDLLREIEMTEQRATRHLNLHMALETILLRLRDAVTQSAMPQPA